MRRGRIEHIGGAALVHRLEIGHVLARAAEQRRAMYGRLAALRRTHDVIGIGDVSLHYLYADRRQRLGVAGIADEGSNGIAPFDQLFADVGAR